MATAVGWLSGDHHERTGASAAFIVSVADLLSEGAPLSTAPAVVLTVLAAASSRTRPDQASAQNRSGPERWKPAPARRVFIVARMRSTEECYLNALRYSAGVMPVARRN